LKGSGEKGRGGKREREGGGKYLFSETVEGVMVSYLFRTCQICLDSGLTRKLVFKKRKLLEKGSLPLNTVIQNIEA